METVGWEGGERKSSGLAGKGKEKRRWLAGRKRRKEDKDNWSGKPGESKPLWFL